MKRYTLELEDKTFRLLEEINKHYYNDDGFNSSIEETLNANNQFILYC